MSELLHDMAYRGKTVDIKTHLSENEKLKLSKDGVGICLFSILFKVTLSLKFILLEWSNAATLGSTRGSR